MSLFEVLPISGSGMDVMQTWLDTVSGNIANMNDGVNPTQQGYQPEYVFAVPLPGDPMNPDPNAQVGQGVEVGAIEYSSSSVLAYQPNNPQAATQDQVQQGQVPQADQGMVKYPDVDLGAQMVDAVMAQTSYQADAQVITKATSAYNSAMQIGA